jgi:DNA-binding transcriptional regulator YiaG
MKDLKKKRIKSGLSQDDFGFLLGVTSRTVRNWESGKIEIKRGYIEAINKALTYSSKA